MKPYLYHIITLLLVLLFPSESLAQRFKVESFRMLPNDVTAFIEPIKDLNDEGCALVKVQAPADFAFSTPLGIVKRIDKTGEIWLYLPKGSKMITLKHPEWGVMRDYRFPEKLDSHVSYELRISEPKDINLRMEMAKTEATTIRDTLLLVHTDTLVLTPVRPRIPFNINVIATVGFGGNTKSAVGGIMLTAMKRFGGFVHISTDFGNIGKTTQTCDRYGKIGDTNPFYTGKVKHSNFMVNAGATQRISSKVAVFEGLGYGKITTGWELAESEGGGYVKNSYYSHKGLSFEVGTIVTFGRLSLSASISCLRGKQWFGNIGAGIRIGKLTGTNKKSK